MSKIFISYRRDDSADVTGRISDRLRGHFGDENVFTDVDDIPPGVDFHEHLENAVRQCDVLLAVIGQTWLSATNDSGERRLDDPADFVRIEIESALNRGIPVIPLLVQGAGMPEKTQLPDTLESLTRRNAQPVRRDPDFNTDMHRLISGPVLESLNSGIDSKEAQRSPVTRWLRNNAIWLGATGIAAIIALFSPVLNNVINNVGDPQSAMPTQTVDPSAVPTPRGEDFIAPEMVRIPAGSFMMGSNNGFDREKPMREVSVPAFEMARHELTWAEWEACENDGGCNEILRPWAYFDNVPVSERPTHPVVYVDIDSVNEYLTWLNEQTGLVYRLPSEAEWEYAARAGSTTVYSWGDDLGKNQANCDGCGSQWDNQSTAPVGSFQPNAFGLNDMHGNVWEWTADCWHKNYEGAPTDGSAWVDSCDVSTGRPLRGGSWLSPPENLRAANRNRDDSDFASNVVGFRLARTLP